MFKKVPSGRQFILLLGLFSAATKYLEVCSLLLCPLRWHRLATPLLRTYSRQALAVAIGASATFQLPHIPAVSFEQP